MPTIPLNVMHSGEIASIEELLGPPSEIQRLEELGLRIGKAVEMIQPGSTCIVRLGSCKLCLRSGEGCHILVRPGVAA